MKYDIVGKTFYDRFGNPFVVECFDHKDKNKPAYYKIRFLQTGYETTASSGHIRGNENKRPQDRLFPSVHGVGILGYAYAKDDPKMFDVWRAMIARCYNPKNPRYKTYGAEGVKVCNRWKRFDYFLEDVKNLPGYNHDKILSGELTLDKDTICRSKKIYSPETCCFVSKAENSREAANRRWNKNKM